MPKPDIEYQNIPDGFSARSFNQLQVVYLAPQIVKNPHVGSKAMVAFTTTGAVIQGLSQRNADGITGKALAQDIEVEVQKTHAPRAALINATRERRAELEIARKTALDFAFLNNQYPSPLRSDLRQNYILLKVGARIAAALNSDLPLALSILEGGKALAGLDDDTWAKFEDHAMTLLHVHRHGADAKYRKQSTVNRITDAGFDDEAARRAAQESIAAQKAEIQTLDMVESYLQSEIRAVAALTRRDAEEFI